MPIESWVCLRRGSRWVLLAVAILTASGCVISKEGVGVSLPVSEKRVAQRTKQLWANALRKGKPNAEPSLIAIGGTSVFRQMTDENADSLYESYKKVSGTWYESTDEAMSKDDFVKSFEGWSKLGVLKAAGIAALYFSAWVPKGMSESIRFFHSLKTILWLNREDLVAARTNHDGVMVIDKLLCVKDDTYKACRKRYALGLFDGVTGQQLDTATLAPARRAKLIDTKTFLRIVPSDAKKRSSTTASDAAIEGPDDGPQQDSGDAATDSEGTH